MWCNLHFDILNRLEVDNLFDRWTNGQIAIAIAAAGTLDERQKYI